MTAAIPGIGCRFSSMLGNHSERLITRVAVSGLFSGFWENICRLSRPFSLSVIPKAPACRPLPMQTGTRLTQMTCLPVFERSWARVS